MNRRSAIKLATLAVLAGGVIALYFSPLRAYVTKAHLKDLIVWLRGLWYGPLVLIVLYAAGCVFAIPASIFVIAAGVIWGWKLGAVYAITGGMLGAVASYYVGGFLGEGLLEKFGSAGHAVRRQVESAGFTSMLIVRLIPGPPFAVWNYAAGIARMRFRDYFWATLLGVIPSHIVFTYCADSLINGTMTQGDALRRLAIVCALLLALIAIPLFIKKRLGARILPTEE
ncbi:MAG TPA: TVP38/TMEM64 family protein [Thermoanaerobaculia bacterium]|nr:TVP38/TMEM64 family protein [Thermoanaerobaculia bacterium]